MRPFSALLAVSLIAALVGSAPAHADTEPTTLAVDGTIEVVVIDHVATAGGDAASSGRVQTLVTDDGDRIPVDLDDAPADARFSGELVVAGAVASALDRKNLLPSAGATIAESTRAGRVAVAAASAQTRPLTVASSTLTPARAAAPVPAEHRAYLAKMTGVGSVDGSDAEIVEHVDDMLGYWVEESDGAIPSFPTHPLDGSIPTFDAPPDVDLDNGCGLGDLDGAVNSVFTAADRLYPDVDFGLPGNHLVILVGDECWTTGTLGAANLGTGLSDGGGAVLTYIPDMFNQIGAHELGHNFGLEHANLDTCPDEYACEYYDFYSIMGLALGGAGGRGFTPPALGSLHRSELGLAGPGELATVTAAPGQAIDQTFQLEPRGSASGLRGVLATDPVTGVRYSIDLRDRAGRDDGAFYGSGFFFERPTPVYETGVVVERQAGLAETYLMTTKARRDSYGSFVAGTSFTPSPGLTVTVVSDESPASVRVQLAAPVPPAPSPTSFRAKTPRITGTARVGRTLEVAVGSWSPRPSFSYQWYANGRKITTKGTKSSFRLTSKQKGKRITVKVTGRKAGYATVTRTSKSTRKVAPRK